MTEGRAITYGAQMPIGMLNAGVMPWVTGKCSPDASGDLAPSAHIPY